METWVRKSEKGGVRRGKRHLMAGLAAAAMLTSTWVAGDVQAAEAGAATARIEVGQAVPDFELQSSDDVTYKLSENADQKSRVLIFFRGTW